MAKTTNPDVYLVKPTYMERNLVKPRVWYIKALNPAERKSLTRTGNVVTHVTKAGRTITVAAVDDVSDGKSYNVGGNIVTIVKDLNVPISTQVAESSDSKPAKAKAAPKPKAPSKDEVNAAIHAEAHAAGMKAGEGITPEPMYVVERANVLDDNSPIVKSYEPIMDGVCGFAWVNIKPGTCSFARWASKQPALRGGGNLVHKSYYGGVDLWVGLFDQSMTRKKAYAGAYAQVLRDHGIKAHAMSRMD